MSGKGFLSTLTRLDAQRLQKSVKATVQNSGRLTFAMDAVKEMELSEDKSIIILAAENGDLGAALSVKGDPNAFVLKKCGAYFYVTFKNYLQQAGVDYKSQRIIYDITELDEEFKPGVPLYKFERRILPKGCKEDEEAETENQQNGQTDVQQPQPDAGEAAATVRDATDAPVAAATAADAPEGDSSASGGVPAPDSHAGDAGASAT